MNRTTIYMALLLMITAAFSVSAQNFREWDKDQDNYITDYEFQVQLEDREYFSSYDLNTDGRIDEAEWEATCKKCDFLVREYRRQWDVNQDGYIHEGEFIRGAYSAWDENDDGYIADAEYNVSYSEWELIR